MLSKQSTGQVLIKSYRLAKKNTETQVKIAKEVLKNF